MNSDVLVWIALQHLWQSALLFVGTTLMLRRCPLKPGAGAWTWLAVLALAALLPLTVFGPRAAPLPTLPLVADVMTAAQQVRAPVAMPGGAVPASAQLTAFDALVFIWFAGVVWQLGRIGQGWRAARQLRRRASVLPRLQYVMNRLGRYTIAACDGVASPLAVGLIHPCILIPRALAASLSDAQLVDVMQHEIAHIRRGDRFTSLAQRLFLALYWWSPVFRLMGARLDLAREMACDAQAASRSGKPAAYASALLACGDIVARTEDSNLLGSRMFGTRPALTQRIEALLRPRAERSKARRVAVGLAWGASMALMMGVTVAATPRLAGTGVNTGVAGEGTPLIVAARDGDVQQVDALLGMGAKVDLAWPGDGNPLIVAAAHGRMAVVARLVAAGANPNAVTPYDETPLINAARAGHLEIVRYLVAHGARVNLGVWADGQRWRTPLNQAAPGPVRAFLISQGAT